MKPWSHLTSSFKWVKPGTKRQNTPLSFIVSFVHDHSTKNYGPHWFILFYFHTTIWQIYMVLFHLFSFAHGHTTKIYGPLSFILSVLHYCSTKNCDPYRFISFICTQPFDQRIWSSFICFSFWKRPFDQKICSSLIYFFFSERPFDQKLGFSLIYFFYLRTTIRLKCMVLFRTFFLCARPFQ